MSSVIKLLRKDSPEQEQPLKAICNRSSAKTVLQNDFIYVN